MINKKHSSRQIFPLPIN